jgi:hypothetical protein
VGKVLLPPGCKGSQELWQYTAPADMSAQTGDVEGRLHIKKHTERKKIEGEI